MLGGNMQNLLPNEPLLSVTRAFYRDIALL